MKFKMNNIEYEIKEISQKDYKAYRKEEDEKIGCEITNTTIGVYYGATHNYTNIIFLDKDLHLDKKRKTLIHELTHCYISEYIAHEDKNFTEEDVADIVANTYDIIHKIVEDYFSIMEV